jgi:hypothetical protein
MPTSKQEVIVRADGDLAACPQLCHDFLRKAKGLQSATVWVMKGLLEVECLACGGRRMVAGKRLGEVGECPECAYLGWAPVAALDDKERRLLREHLSNGPRHVLGDDPPNRLWL